MSKIAAILIRGLVGVKHDIKLTLVCINLRKKHACTILEDTPTIRGMLKKSRDFITFGPVSDEVLQKLETKKKVCDETKTVYFLSPPRGGFERKGIKRSFTVGGALGDRKEAINDLLLRMI